ncbi:MAG: hypothetical protein WCJ01_07415 [Ignavibacteria bacterium]
MNRITESSIEEFAIEQLECPGYRTLLPMAKILKGKLSKMFCLLPWCCHNPLHGIHF